MSLARSAAWWICLAAAGVALAAEVQTPEDPRRLDAPRATDRMNSVLPGQGTAIARAADAFVARYGGTWTFHADPRTGRIALAQGSGIPLGASWGATRRADAAEATLDDLIEPVRDFIEAWPALVGSPSGDLVLDRGASQVRRGGRLASLAFGWRLDGVPVEGAVVFVRLNAGRITQFGSRFVGGVELFPLPEIDAEEARAALLAYSGDVEDARFLGEPALLVTPVDDGAVLDYRMVWRMSYRLPGRPETWEGRVDARTGATIGFRDTNVYGTGQARGGVFPRTVWLRDETPAPFPFLEVRVGDRTHHADAAGRFRFDGGAVQAGLSSRHLRTFCVDCIDPAHPAAGDPIGSGLVDFGSGGGDQFGNGYSTSADRNVYYHVHQVRRIAEMWLPRLRWLGRSRLTSNVNLDLACNAFYDHAEQSINFFRSGGGCNNTGMIADVIWHEWGHGIDFATLVLDGATGEGTADVVAMHMSRDPAIAPGFYVDGRPIRDLNAATNPLGRMTLERVQAGDCMLPNGGESIHCIGTVYGQAAWELAQALVARYGEYTGWRMSERLFYESLPDAGSLDPASPLSIYAAYLQADDTDGNLANGTPNADLIHAAFAAHGIAQAALPREPGGPRPAQPVLAATPRCDGIELRWSPVVGAVRYELLRTELVNDGPLYPVATLSAAVSTYFDEAVVPGFDHRYAVLAVHANGGESNVEPGPPVRLSERPLLSVVAVEVADAPLGNRSGAWDPGETLLVVPILANRGRTPATLVSGRLEPVTPGVSLLSDRMSTTWPDLAPGEQAAAEQPLVVRIDPTVACGTRLEFRLVPADAGGCTAEDPSWFPLQVGAPDERAGFVCDDTPACLDAPEFAGLELAVPGACGEVFLRWFHAQSRCANAEVVYDVYRGETPDFALGPAARIVAGLSANSWTDRLLVPGATVHYRVRAIDTRSGPDANERVVSAVVPGGLDDRPPHFAATLTAVSGEACGETELSWEPAQESCSLPVTYNVYRSTEPDFTPGPGTLVASTTAAGYTDLAEAGRFHHYAVRAADDAGNVAAAEPRAAARARVFDRLVLATSFEGGPDGWRVTGPNDAVRGNWEWGDPEGSGFQPEHDATPDGAYCWATGLAFHAVDGNNNDVDFGTTTLASPRYDIADTVDPVVRYSRWFTNDRSVNPGDPRDSLRVQVSDDDGLHWTLLEEVGAGTPLAWVGVELPLAGLVAATDRLRLRVLAADVGQGVEDGSIVEAAIDDFSIIDRDQGCAGCDDSAQVVEAVEVRREGEDVVLTWPAGLPGTRYTVGIHAVDHAGTALPAGSTGENRFVHRGAVLSRSSFRYRVTAVARCGDEAGAVQRSP